ncbi:MAG: division/cell wall cluster transcriptional repressor MraZ [Christensenellaceae bacterium]
MTADERSKIVFHDTIWQKLDNKNRMRLPAKSRETLHACGGWFILAGTNYISVFPSFVKEEFASLFADEYLNDDETELTLELVFGSMLEVDEDEQGRFVLPPSFRSIMRIGEDKDIVFVGAGNHINIYSSAVYHERFDDKVHIDARERMRLLMERKRAQRKESAQVEE